MAGEQDPKGGGESQKPAGTPPVKPEDKPQPKSIPEEVLPEQLRGRSPEEIRFVLSNLVSGVTTANQRLQQLEKELEEAKKGASERKEPDKPKKPPEERILEDPEAVIQEVVERLYGSTVETISAGVSEAAYRGAKSDYPDFKDVEEEVKKTLKDAKVPPTRENIDRAYAMVIGQKSIEERRKAAAKATNPLEAKGDKLDAPAKPEEPEGLEKEVWQSSGMSLEDWHKYKKGDFEVKVPTGRKPAASGKEA